jgi:hypothetical protein
MVSGRERGREGGREGERVWFGDGFSLVYQGKG